ncbi:MAG: ComF family protein [Bacteroidales bacterium]|nr:ComF family protein [Bacteroidales bacterium]
MLTDLVFPRVCPLCGNVLVESEKMICSRCLTDLPQTHFKNMQDNPVARMFWGRVPFAAATSYLFFEKGNKARKLIHEIKYHDNKELGYESGLLTGYYLRGMEIFTDIDFIVPVPLHKRKYKIRGYNQSEWIGKGVSEVLAKPVDCDNLYRKVFNPSQTRKNRYSRWKNVEGIFDLRDPDKFAGKHLLLIDDVITTGSTIEACSLALRKAPGTRISIVSLAFAY